MADFPIEILVNIFSRLPVATLLRFRCVSKSIRALIDSPFFVKLHIDYSITTNSNRIVISENSTKFDYVEVDNLNIARKLKVPSFWGKRCYIVAGSCNGLILVRHGRKYLSLWNPSTRKHFDLPVSPVEIPNVYDYHKVYGLGYDHLTDDYKVVRLVHCKLNYKLGGPSFLTEAKVYSLKSNFWRRIQDCPYSLYYVGCHGIFAGNALHWVVDGAECGNGNSNSIVALDLGTEVYRLLSLPEDKDTSCMIGSLGNVLWVLCYPCNRSLGLEAYILVMTGYGVNDCWSRLTTFVHQFYSKDGYPWPVAFSKCGGKLLCATKKRIFWFDLKMMTVEDVAIQGISGEHLIPSVVCFESLVQFGGGVGERS